jgi:hypothetical protein
MIKRFGPYKGSKEMVGDKYMFSNVVKRMGKLLLLLLTKPVLITKTALEKAFHAIRK